MRGKPSPLCGIKVVIIFGHNANNVRIPRKKDVARDWSNKKGESLLQRDRIRGTRKG